MRVAYVNVDGKNVAGIREMDITNGEGIGVALFTQGCLLHCFNCFNSETWPLDGGIEYTQEMEDKIIELLRPSYIKRLSILGGEPLLPRNKEPLTQLVKRVSDTYGNTKKIWLYTGSKYESIMNEYSAIVDNVDVLVDGPYIDECRDYRLKWCGSTNQRVIDIEDTIVCGHIVEHKTK